MRVIAFAYLIALAGCAGSGETMTATVSNVLSDGQLACAARNAVVAMQTSGGQPILAKGATSEAVSAVCGLINGVAVSPPAAGVAGTVTVTLPPTLSVPLPG